jgi:hypothetical protein
MRSASFAAKIAALARRGSALAATIPNAVKPMKSRLL